MPTSEKHEIVYKIACKTCNSAPTEYYILFQRTITFLDEWLLYALLVGLYVNDYMTVFWPTAVIGTVAILNSYARLWRMEELRFGGKTKHGT